MHLVGLDQLSLSTEAEPPRPFYAWQRRQSLIPRIHVAEKALRARFDTGSKAYGVPAELAPPADAKSALPLASTSGASIRAAAAAHHSSPRQAREGLARLDSVGIQGHIAASKEIPSAL